MRKILCIDGGGIKGAFPASFLAAIEENVGDNVSKYFDLIVGTSTGGIIALGLGLGMTSKEILSFYEGLGPKVFKGVRPFLWFKKWFVTKYDQKPLRVALEDKFKKRKLGESSIRLVIPSLNLETGKVHIYKTSHHERLENDYKKLAVDIALATAAAPTYFPAFRSNDGIPLVDGGMWANNPVGLAAVEAIGILGWNQSDIRILSLGCTTELLNIGLGRKVGFGLGYWGLKIVDLFMAAQSSASLSTAQVLIGKPNIKRISPNIPKGRFTLDSVSEIESLRGLGRSEAREAIPELRRLFFDEHAETFEPYYKEN
jgi:hypothetical protein